MGANSRSMRHLPLGERAAIQNHSRGKTSLTLLQWYAHSLPDPGTTLKRPMNFTRKIYLLSVFSLAVAATSLHAQVTNYDTIDGSAIAGYSEANANNPIFGDALTLSAGGGELALAGFTLFNSTSGGNSGSISKGLMTVFIYDNTIPYTGTGPIGNPVLWAGQLLWDFGSNPLPAGFYTIGIWDFNGLGLFLPQNILITQQFGLTQGT